MTKSENVSNIFKIMIKISMAKMNNKQIENLYSQNPTNCGFLIVHYVFIVDMETNNSFILLILIK